MRDVPLISKPSSSEAAFKALAPRCTDVEMNDAGTDASGHRARLRQRLLDGGPDALLDHELIEFLLMLAIPRRDTKPLAQKLIAASERC
jgi:hypothetical protein